MRGGFGAVSYGKVEAGSAATVIADAMGDATLYFLSVARLTLIWEGRPADAE